METIGFIGVGTMGSGLLANLLRAGFEVLAFDIEAAHRGPAGGQGRLPARRARQRQPAPAGASRLHRRRQDDGRALPAPFRSAQATG
jgi:3-hydroxyisobutyrate dehydrogenase-like beta-hydroxyacid dehydrogenase